MADHGSLDSLRRRNKHMTPPNRGETAPFSLSSSTAEAAPASGLKRPSIHTVVKYHSSRRRTSQSPHILLVLARRIRGEPPLAQLPPLDVFVGTPRCCGIDGVVPGVDGQLLGA